MELLLAHDPQLLELPGAGERTALIAAAANGHLDLVRWLLSKGANPRRRESDGTRALDWAAQQGHRAVVEELLAHDPELLDLPGFKNRTALIAAAGKGEVELVRALLDRGADPAKRMSNGSRALDWAAQQGHQTLVELLLARDAQLLELPGFRERTALIAAAGNGHAELTRSLLERGADPRRWMDNGEGALHWACEAGHLAVVQVLLAQDRGLVDLPGKAERTALIAAAGRGHDEVVRVLLERGADPHKRESDGTRALDWAAQEGHQAVVELLLARDPGLLDLQGYNDRTALMAASGNGHVDLVRLLLKRGADPRKRVSTGETALHWAAERGHEAVVQLLLARWVQAGPVKPAG
jgi:ankyrin repeat protein